MKYTSQTIVAKYNKRGMPYVCNLVFYFWVRHLPTTPHYTLTPTTSYKSLTCRSGGFDVTTLSAGLKNIRAQRWQTHAHSCTHKQAHVCVPVPVRPQSLHGYLYVNNILIHSIFRLEKSLSVEFNHICEVDKITLQRGLSKKEDAPENASLHLFFLLQDFDWMFGNLNVFALTFSVMIFLISSA